MAPYARHNRHKQELRDARDRAEKYLGYRRKLAAIDREERDAHHAITSQRTAYRSLGFVQHQRADPKTDVRPYLTPAARADHDAISARAQRARADLEEALARVATHTLGKGDTPCLGRRSRPTKGRPWCVQRVRHRFSKKSPELS